MQNLDSTFANSYEIALIWFYFSKPGKYVKATFYLGKRVAPPGRNYFFIRGHQSHPLVEQ